MLYGGFEKTVCCTGLFRFCFSIITSPSSPLRHHPFTPHQLKHSSFPFLLNDLLSAIQNTGEGDREPCLKR
ncbi:hypothetical protein Hdeb2414_s0626g00926381 [Helianthus debilis subsp. tardiflorus]